MKSEQPDDQVLWEAIKNCDKESLGHLYELYYKPLFRFGSKQLSDTDLIEDAIQDLFINLWNTRQKLPPVHNVKAYLFTILSRSINRQSKKEQLTRDIDSISSLFEIDDKSGYEHIDHEKWLVAKLATVLKGLPKRQLDVILLRYYENFQTSEIASIMGISEKSVRNTMYKALTYLREHIQPLDYLLILFIGCFS